MSEAPRTGGTGHSPDGGPAVPPVYPGAPRWVKRLGFAILALVALIVLATVLGLHTPGGPGGHGF